ncbi:MAG TPA: FecR domain-containing protein [Opitutaceae bacterium]|nr:FecR domain-containing protein [Opitutaceae bacterium]
MKPPSPEIPDDQLRITAANWIVRRDRGLSAAESIEYELWLAADRRHAAAIQRSSFTWSVLNRLPEGTALPVLTAATRRRTWWRRAIVGGSLAAAAAVVLGMVILLSESSPRLASAPSSVFTAHYAPQTLTLSDGSQLQLNTGGEVMEQFTANERQVLLVRGEAHFSVVKDPSRPFIVRAGALQVHAVGTAFDIKLKGTAVDVIVTEGRVKLTPHTPTDVSGAPSLVAGERAILHGDLSPESDLAHALVRSQLDSTELAAALVWREPLLRLGGATLRELALEFKRVTGKHIEFADPSLAEMRFGGRIRNDDIEAFTQVLVATLDLEVERVADGTIVLRKKNSHSR